MAALSLAALAVSAVVKARSPRGSEPAAAVGDHRAAEGGADCRCCRSAAPRPRWWCHRRSRCWSRKSSVPAPPGLGHAAVARDAAVEGPVGGLVEGHIGIVHDAALRAVAVALQDAAADSGAQLVAAGAGEDDLARAVLGQRAEIAGDIAGKGAGDILVEDQAAKVDDIALQADGGALQRARGDEGAAGIVVGAGQDQRAVTRLGQPAPPPPPA